MLGNIQPISDEVTDKIRRKSAYSLPDDPSGRGMKPDEIRRAFYSHVISEGASVISEINRIVAEANAVLDAYGQGKLDKIMGSAETLRAYAVDSEGVQTAIEVSDSPIGGSIAKRTREGNISVGVPTEGDHAVSKEYFADELLQSEQRLASRLTLAEQALGAVEGADGGKEYPELQTDNTAVIPALNELLARLGVIAGEVEQRAESHDTCTTGSFSHTGSLSVSEGISAGRVSADTVVAGTLSGDSLTLGERASIPTLASDSISVQNLNVTGKAVIKEQEQVLIRDSVMVLNSDGESIDGAYSGIVMRSGEADTAYAILLNMGTQSVRLGYGRYDEEENRFVFSEGEVGAIMTREESELLSDGGALCWDAESHRARTIRLDATLAEELFDALADRRLPEYEGNYLCVSEGSIRLTPPERLVSVSEVEQTTTSSADGGTNVVTVRLSDGSASSFEVRNGSRGSKGDKGEKGDAGDLSLSYAGKSFANAIKGSASGEVVILNDVSPISHELELSVSTEGSPESVSVTCHGRNIFDPEAYGALPMTNTTLVGDVFTTEFISNGSYINAPWNKGIVIPKGRYTISIFSADGDMNIGISLYPANSYDRDLGFISCRGARSVQKTVDMDEDFRITVKGVERPEGGYGTYSYRIMVEEGDPMGEYVPYAGSATYTPDEDGRVRGAMSFYPETYIGTNSENALIHCDYSRDLSAVISSLTQAIVALGGAV